MKSVAGGSEQSLESAARLRLVLFRLARALRHQGSTALTPSQLSALATLEELGPLRISALAARGVGGRTGRHARRREPRRTRVSWSELMTPTTSGPASSSSPTHGRETLAAVWGERTVGLSSRMDRLTPSERSKLEAALPAFEKIARDS